MSQETTEAWRNLRQIDQEEREERRQQNLRRLQELKDRGLVRTEVFSRHHVRVSRAGRTGRQVDFWPSTGRSKVLGTRQSRHGWDALLEALDIGTGPGRLSSRIDLRG